MESEKPYPAVDGGVAPPSTPYHRYQILTEVQQFSSSEDDEGYDYPLAVGSGLYPASIVAAAVASDQAMANVTAAANELEESGAWEDTDGTLRATHQSSEKLGGVGGSSSSLSESEGEATGVIRQGGSRVRIGQKQQDGDDDKLYVKGNLNCAQLDIPVDKTDAQFADEGIYQGLVMTNREKEELGILPEAIYMTTKLIENGELIESLSNAAVSAIQVPEMPLPPNSPSLFKDEGANAKATLPISQPPAAPGKKADPAGTRSSSSIKSNRSTLEVKHHIMPRYRDLILRPPPLPPLAAKANRAEKRVYGVVDNLLKSEAAYLTSLNIAIQVYMVPLRELAQSSAPILSMEEVNCLFGTIEEILKFQEIFYSAITVRTLDWKPDQKIGDVLSSLSNKDVINNYSMYINNFTNAMTMLGNAINKKPRFVQFYKEKYAASRTSLSLQGLLLKPIQRFPQYIMFLQDLIKFTHASHPDRVTLQLALARYEGITNFLNEHKRQREQMMVVQNLTHKVSHLPFKLTDGKRWLHRQDIVSRVMMSNGRLVSKDRCLLLFSNMILCAAMRRRKKRGSDKSRKEDLESTTGSRDFETISDFLYTCKWYCPLEKLEVIEPDYLSDIWDRNSSILKDNTYLKLKEDYKKLEQDFLQVSHIATTAATLHEEYQGLSVADLATHVRVLQRKIAKIKGDIKAMQHGRMDVRLPTREGDKMVCHTYIFRSEKTKLTWVNSLRYSKHKLHHPVSSSWMIAEDIADCDIFEVSYKLPLFVESYNLNLINNEVMSVQCGTKIGTSCAWLASGDNSSAQISIVECVTPSPLILECFKVNSKRILDIAYVPPSPYILDPDNKDTLQQQQQKKKVNKGSGSMTHLPAYLATIWMGSQCGKLSVYSAEVSSDSSKQCLARITLKDSITSIQYYQDQVFAMTANGEVVIFKRLMSGFNLSSYKSVKVLQEGDLALRCSCKVGNKMWLAVGGFCKIFNMQTHEEEGVVHMTSGDHVVINNMVYQGEGVWVSYKGSSSLELFHTASKQSLQNIDVQTALQTIIKRRKLENRVGGIPSRVYVTSILASHGYLWIGTNVGCILVYHIPYLDTVPIVSGKPYLAMDSHMGSVRVILPIHTSVTVESSRVKQFEDDESHRRTLLLEEEESIVEFSNKKAMDFEDTEGKSTIRKRSSSLPPEIFSSKPSEDAKTRQDEVQGSPYARPGDLFASDGKEIPEGDLKRSSTITAADISLRSQKLNTLQGKSEARQGNLVTAKVDAVKKEEKETNRESDSKKESGDRNGGKESSSTNTDQSSKEEVTGGVKDREVNEENRETQVEKDVKEEEDDDYDYNSDELENKEKFRGGVRPVSSANADTSPKLRSFAVLAQESLQCDSGEYTIPQELDAIRNSAVAARYGNVMRETDPSEENPYNDPRELDGLPATRRDEFAAVEDENPYELIATKGGDGGKTGPYDDPTELCMLDEVNGVGKDGPYDDPTALDLPNGEKGETQDGPYDAPTELGLQGETNNREGPYDDPTALDTMKKLSTLELISKSKEAANQLSSINPYHFPGELAGADESVHPYEDPATLAKGGEVSSHSSLFSTKALNNSLYIPRKNSGVTEGSVFVLTAGRGLRNLRTGRKVSIFNQANKDAEACMMAYEIELQP